MHSPTLAHWGMLKRVFQYVKGTFHFGLRIQFSTSIDLHAFFNPIGLVALRIASPSAFVMFLGRNLVSWVCHKQHIVAWSLTEAEYKGLANVSVEVTWVVSLLGELGVSSLKPPKMWCDNLGAMYLCANSIFHSRAKHVEIDYHFIRDKVSSSDLQVHFIFSKDQLAKNFTK